MIRAFLHDLAESLRHALAYAIVTIFVGTLYVPGEWLA